MLSRNATPVCAEKSAGEFDVSFQNRRLSCAVTLVSLYKLVYAEPGEPASQLAPACVFSAAMPGNGTAGPGLFF
jgi:hypothetical protein